MAPRSTRTSACTPERASVYPVCSPPTAKTQVVREAPDVECAVALPQIASGRIATKRGPGVEGRDEADAVCAFVQVGGAGCECYGWWRHHGQWKRRLLRVAEGSSPCTAAAVAEANMTGAATMAGGVEAAGPLLQTSSVMRGRRGHGLLPDVDGQMDSICQSG